MNSNTLKSTVSLSLLGYCISLFFLVFFLSQFKLDGPKSIESSPSTPSTSMTPVDNMVPTDYSPKHSQTLKKGKQPSTPTTPRSHKSFHYDTKEPETKNTREIPNFSIFSDTKEKKQEFINFFKEIINEQNALQLKRKEQLSELAKLIETGRPLNEDATRVLNSLLVTYRIPSELELPRALTELKLRVNTIPGSMVLAQAASESAWGTSRFAKKANNFFGQWCFKKGCGIIPKKRKADAKHEIAIFKSAESSVRAYFKNLNTYKTYKEFRILRSELEKQEKTLAGLKLTQGLKRYSERGEEYIEDLKAIIRFNKFDALFDEL